MTGGSQDSASARGEGSSAAGSASKKRAQSPQRIVVHVAVDRGHRGQGLELGDDVAIPYISGMQDVLHVREDLEDFRPELSVGVGDDAKAHWRLVGETASRRVAWPHPCHLGATSRFKPM